jgi:hypothetical protein
VATTNCTASVASIAMGAALGDNHGRVGSNTKPCANAGRSSLSCNAALSCKNGSYTGYANAFVTFPPGFEPPTANLSAKSKTVSVTC